VGKKKLLFSTSVLLEMTQDRKIITTECLQELGSHVINADYCIYHIWSQRKLSIIMYELVELLILLWCSVCRPIQGYFQWCKPYFTISDRW